MQMKGTEKQIAWASDIKEAWKLSLEDAHRFREKVGAKAPMPEEIREYIDELMNETDAAKVIEKYGRTGTKKNKKYDWGLICNTLPDELSDLYFDWVNGLLEEVAR